MYQIKYLAPWAFGSSRCTNLIWFNAKVNYACILTFYSGHKSETWNRFEMNTHCITMVFIVFSSVAPMCSLFIEQNKRHQFGPKENMGCCNWIVS